MVLWAAYALLLFALLRRPLGRSIWAEALAAAGAAAIMAVLALASGQ